jgi:hypothetical protein
LISTIRAPARKFSPRERLLPNSTFTKFGRAKLLSSRNKVQAFPLTGLGGSLALPF